MLFRSLEISKHLNSVLSKHAIVRDIDKCLEINETISINDVSEKIVKLYPDGALTDKTAKTYTNKFLKYLVYSGHYVSDGTTVRRDRKCSVDFSMYYTPNRSGVGVLSGSPKKAKEICVKIKQDGYYDKSIKGSRNTINDLSVLGIVEFQRDAISFVDSISKMIDTDSSIDKIIIKQLLKSSYVIAAKDELQKGNTALKPIYEGIREQFGLNWSDSSIKRNIETVVRWLKYYNITSINSID